MRFLSTIRISENSGQVPSEQLRQDMGQLIDEMTREGTLVRTAGLPATREDTRVRLRVRKLSTIDRPFAETQEVIGGGFAILEAKSMQEALELTKRSLKIPGDGWNMEVRGGQMEGPEFGAST